MRQRTFRNESRDDYLEAILLIRQRKGFCRSTDIAAELDISKPSVSVELGKLIEQGLVIFDTDKMIHLTDEGLTLAEQTYRKHVYFRQLLMSAGIDGEVAEKEACAMEHAISDESFQKILAHFPVFEPNG